METSYGVVASVCSPTTISQRENLQRHQLLHLCVASRELRGVCYFIYSFETSSITTTCTHGDIHASGLAETSTTSYIFVELPENFLVFATRSTLIEAVVIATACIRGDIHFAHYVNRLRKFGSVCYFFSSLVGTFRQHNTIQQLTICD